VPKLIAAATVVPAVGSPAKRIEEFVGRVNSGTEAGQAVHVAAGEWVRYSTPAGATYIAVCLPAFSPDTVRRDA